MRFSRRRWIPCTTRLASRYVAAAGFLTLALLLTHPLAPAGGLTRSFYYGLPRDADPFALDVRTMTAVEDSAESVDLAFVDEFGDWLTGDYFVRWRGVWFSPRAELIELHARADDGMVVRVDGAVVLERHPVGRHPVEASRISLDAGAHTLEVDYWQREGDGHLDVHWAPAGGEPAPLGAGPVFPTDPGAPGYLLWAMAQRLPALLLLVWGGPVVILLFGQLVRRRASALTGAEAVARLRVAALPALLGPSQLLLFGPWTVHATNRTEFLLPFWSLAPHWIGFLALLGALLAASGLLLPPGGFRLYVAGLCAVGVLLWAQGNLLVGNHGWLDGGSLDLAAPVWRVPVEAGIWIGVLALALVFAGTVARAAPTASALLMTLQAAVLTLHPLTPDEARPATGDRAETWRLPPTEIYELSADRNLIHIVLDTFPSNLFADIRDADRPAFDEAWSGFTFYRDHLGIFTGTMPSMPAMLTGVAWRNEVPIDSFVRRHPTVFHALGQQGYRLRALGRTHPGGHFPGAASTLRYDIPSPYGSYRDYVDTASAQLLDLSLFRHAPHPAKTGIYREGQWFLQSRTVQEQEGTALPYRPIGNASFVREFAGRITAAGSEPVYTFLHLLTPHPPIVADAHCGYTGRLRMSPDNFRAQARCALRAVESLLDRLRELDIYDRSAIVVTSDHGTTLYPRPDNPLSRIDTPGDVSLHAVELFATPLLLVKPVGARGPMQTSHAPTAITDLPATLLDLVDLPNTLKTGTSVLALDADTPRRRTFAYHSWTGQGPNGPRSRWLDVLHLFSVDGRVTDPDAWRYRRPVFEPADDRAAQRRRHRVGLSKDDSDAAAPADRSTFWTSDYSVFFAPADTGRVTFAVRKASNLAEQNVTVRVDGEVVGHHLLSDEAWRTLDYAVPRRDADNSPFCIELLVSPLWRDTDNYSRGVMVRGDF